MDNKNNNSQPFFKEKSFEDLTPQQQRKLRNAAGEWHCSVSMETVWEAGQRISRETGIDTRIVLQILGGYVAL